jgi:hypothetical protein
VNECRELSLYAARSVDGLLGPVRLHLAVVTALLLLLVPRSSAAGDDAFMARLVARSFFGGIIGGEVGSVLPLCGSRFSFDGDMATDVKQIRQRLGRVNARARQLGLQLRKVIVLGYREAVERYGPPPARLRNVLRPGCMVALARFNMRGAVAVLERQGAFWKVVALTD